MQAAGIESAESSTQRSTEKVPVKLALTRGVSRMRMAYSYRRFPYGHVAHQAAGVIIRAWRAHHRMKNAAAVRAQSAMRRWHTRRDFMDMRTTLLAAMTIIQSHARVKLARLRVHRIRDWRAHRMAQRLQSRWRGGIGRKEAAWWRQERRRLATNIQRRWQRPWPPSFQPQA